MRIGSPRGGVCLGAACAHPFYRGDGALTFVSCQGRLHHRSDALATMGSAAGIKDFCPAN